MTEDSRNLAMKKPAARSSFTGQKKGKTFNLYDQIFLQTPEMNQLKVSMSDLAPSL